MRISTITNWAYGATLLLTGLAGAAFILAAQASDKERAAVEQHLAFDQAAEDLQVGTAVLTNQARLFAVRGADRHLDAYRRELNEVRTRDHAFERVRGMDTVPGEDAALAEAEVGLGELNKIEAAAVADAEHGEAPAAQAILFGPDHERVELSVQAALEHFRALVTARTQTAMRQAQLDADRAEDLAKAMLAITALLFLGVLYFVLVRRVSVPLRRMAGIVTRLARQDYAVEVPDHRRRDEIGEMTDAIQTFRENGLERDRLEAQLRVEQRAKDGILQMMHRLQACESREELAQVVACFAPQTFPELAGRLYILDDDRNALALASSWLDPQHSGEVFPPSACWGVRRGRTHVSLGAREDVSCPHVADPDVHSLCVPLTAQGDTIGLLYFEERPSADAAQGAPRAYLDLMSDNVALTLANLRLRERLANLAVRDALTGLFNRRSLDEALNRHALAPRKPVACIMVDIDHFKRFNDDFGHDAGDAVMQHVAQILRETVGQAGGAYRFGGEEFTVLLPGADADTAFELAEQLRTRIAAAPLAHHGKMLGHITVSLGLAATPVHGPATSILQAADAALLRAKSSGRDRTETAAAAQGAKRIRAAG